MRIRRDPPSVARVLHAVPLTAALAVAGCSSQPDAPASSGPPPAPAAENPAEPPAAEGEAAATRAEAADEANPEAAAVQPLLAAYLAVQQKLSSDDASGARSAFAEVQKATNAAVKSLAVPTRERLSEAAVIGSGTDDLDAQREAFASLTSVLVELVQQRGNPADHELQLAHCPMAFDNEGGSWLQGEGELHNPYFGSKMLTCGSVNARAEAGHMMVRAGHGETPH
jgi:hypothetical protein